MVNRANSRFMLRTVSSLALLVTVGAIVLPGKASAQTVMNVAAGEVEVNDNGICSLREALNNADTNSQAHDDCPDGDGAVIINLAAGSTYTLSDEDPLGNASGLREISTEITINGNGASIERDESLDCVLDGSQVEDVEFRILRIGSSSSNVTLNDLTLRNGCAPGGNPGRDGGAIRIAFGTLALNRVTITDNHAFGTSGGLDTNNAATVTIVDSTFSYNSSGLGGGGIGNGNNSIMTIERSTIVGNTADGVGGGGIGNLGTVTVLNSTISNNSYTGTDAGGGGIGNAEQGTVELVHSTLSGNSATGALQGGGLGNVGTMIVKNSIVANSTAGGDCVNFGSFSALGTNFDTDESCSGFTTSAELALGPLADNGGPTQTHALQTGSIAIGAATDCTQLDGTTPVTEDQRDAPRPEPNCDVGAFQTSPAIAVAPIAVTTLNHPGIMLLILLMALLGGWSVLGGGFASN